MHVNTSNYKAACFAPSLWHVSAARGDFEAAPQLGSLAANFPAETSCARAAIVAKQYYQRETYHSS